MSRFLIASSMISLSLASCRTPASSAGSSTDNYQEVVQGTISYPFYMDTDPLGKNGNEDKFVIKTITGGTEYIVEIPDGADNYEIMVPLAQVKGDEPENRLEKVRNAQLTDRELTSQFPSLDAATEEERMLLDKAFGVSEEGGPRQAPSYTIGLAKLNKLYRETSFELALIEANNLLAFYPTSSRLYKMKGSILIKLGNLKLAEKAWLRAGELSPDDPVIKRGIKSLRRQIKSRQMMARQVNESETKN